MRQWSQTLWQQAPRRTSALGLHIYQQKNLVPAGRLKHNEERWEGDRLDHGLLSPLLSIWRISRLKGDNLGEWMSSHHLMPRATVLCSDQMHQKTLCSSASWSFCKAWKGPGLQGSVDTNWRTFPARAQKLFTWSLGELAWLLTEVGAVQIAHFPRHVHLIHSWSKMVSYLPLATHTVRCSRKIRNWSSSSQVWNVVRLWDHRHCPPGFRAHLCASSLTQQNPCLSTY